MKAYEICLADYEAVLPAIAECLGAEYKVGDFDAAHEAFEESGKAEAWWRLQGLRGKLEIRFEEYEGYFFGTLSASDPEFKHVKQLLWNTYLTQGGNPDVQEAP